MMDVDPNTDPTTFWNELYASKDQVWSGKVNQTLAAVVEELQPGRSLDLGCGEGGDVLWLAEHGWQATGFELSEIAIERARAEAAERGLTERVTFISQNLQDWQPGKDEQFDLVTASFLQSPVFLARDEIISKAANQVAPGGHLLLIAHATPPSWFEGEFPPGFITPEQEVANLHLDGPDWDLLCAELITRNISGPEGQEGTIQDSLVFARRR